MMDDEYEQHKNFSNSCYPNGSNISSRSNKFAATTTHSALAYQKKRGDDRKDKERDNGSANGNTDTAQINKQKASVSGFDNTAEQEAQNLICTHPSSTCVSEGSETNSTDNSG